MRKYTKPVSAPYSIRRINAISERYPPEDVRTFLRMQRRWIRRVIQMDDINPKERLAALFIGSFTTPSVPFCYAGMDYISRHAGCERTTVHRAVKEMEARGFMKVDRAKRGGNIYRIMIPY